MNSDRWTAQLQLAGGERITIDQQQIQDADLRLAYVQHPFPAQGHTTDTAHLITGEQSTMEATYVGLTRARERTDIYALQPAENDPGANRLATLAESLRQTEPDIPSIVTPLAHEVRVVHATRQEVPELDHADESTLEEQSPVLATPVPELILEQHEPGTSIRRRPRLTETAEQRRTLERENGYEI